MIIDIPDTAQTVPLHSVGIGEAFIYGDPLTADVFPLYMRCHPPRSADGSTYWAVNLENGHVAQYGAETPVIPQLVKVVPV